MKRVWHYFRQLHLRTDELEVNGQMSRSQRDITYQHQKRYNSGTDELSKVKLGENYLGAERKNTLHGVQGH